MALKEKLSVLLKSRMIVGVRTEVENCAWENEGGNHFMTKCMAAVLVTLMGITAALPAKAQRRQEDRIQNSALALNAIMNAPDNSIPADFLNRAVCVGVIPSEKKLAFFIGGNYGRGVLVCRRNGNGTWGAPSMVKLGGGSYGFQLGGEAADIVFIVMSQEAAEAIVRQTLKLGVDVSAAAGPVGRRAEAASNAHFSAGILSYSRARGLFAGVSLSGAVLSEDADGNRKLYHRQLTPEQILFEGAVPPPPSAQALDAVLTKYSPHGGAPFKAPKVTHPAP
ncbi:MAG: lipid-binding SYLF domain-containing protein [Acidobacteriota bacterium]|nr:lipid-binding SYLF domain-containing protein [Acidobacteriota bacterium]